MNEIDWNQVRHISHWYAWKHLKRYLFALDRSDIVAEAMLSLVKTDPSKWEKMSLTTIVCNHTRWAACRLYQQHRKNLRLDRSMAFVHESYCVDFNAAFFPDEFRKVIAEAKAKVIGQIREKMGKEPKKPVALSRWQYKHRDSIRMIARYDSGFIEQKVIEQETLDTLANKFRVTRERARQIEGKFWEKIRHAIVHTYEMPLEHVGDLLQFGEVISEPYKKKDVLLNSELASCDSRKS